MPPRRRRPRRTGGRRWRTLVAYILTRDHGICWLCGHPGADTGDHIRPIHTHPHLEFDPTNVRAAHGTKRTLLEHGYTCTGNYGRGQRDAIEPSRPWR